MRRIVPVLIAGGLLLTASACGTAPQSPSAAATGAGPTAEPAVAETCLALSQVYSSNMAPLAQALTDVATSPSATAQAQRTFDNFATAIQDATKASADAGLRADGKVAADQLRAKAKDAAFFKTIKSSADVDKALGSTLTEWLTPVQRHCS
ncbi:hypothetical protein AB0M02_20865 [Actinoplanes sp. NPDC051861]|uniref:hypothetical protein n=1 Tax=Actinoplanes sp. NPDC051861 TaxID=3155170 RepID=UPI003441C3A2